MKKILLLIVAIAVLLSGSVVFASTVDIIQYPTPQFVDPAYPMGNYRWYDEDWGWQHNAISGSIALATLNISAYDVDWSADTGGEHDLIYAKDNGSWTLLGELSGANDIWAYTTFTLGSNFYDDIANGLEVWIDIDSTHNYDNWAVSLAKSALSIDGGQIPNPNPGSKVPEPSTLLLLGAGLFGVGSLRKKFSR